MLTFGVKDWVNAVLEILCLHKEMSMNKLYEIMGKEYQIKISLPQVYKIVADLEKEQIIIKTYGKLELSAFWIKRVDSFVKTAKNNYMEWTISISTLAEWERKQFKVDSLDELDAIRNNIFTQLNTINTTGEVCFFHSHPYYILWANEARSTLIQHVINSWQKLYILFGNETFLDTYGIKLVQMQGAAATCKNNTPFLSEWYNLHIISDYMIELIFPETITQHFKIFFDNIKSLKWFQSVLFKEIFEMKGQYIMTVQHNASQAKKFKELIKKNQKK